MSSPSLPECVSAETKGHCICNSHATPSLHAAQKLLKSTVCFWIPARLANSPHACSASRHSPVFIPRWELEWQPSADCVSLGAAGAEATEAAGPSGRDTSVAVLLSQALRSDDHQLLEKCFAMSNDRVIKSTVRQLAAPDAARLLAAALQRLQSSPKRGKQIAAWLRALLLHHTAYLISAPGRRTWHLSPT